MGFLQRLFGKRASSAPLGVVCPHTTLVPRWNSTDDMGDQSKVSGYRCEACGGTFTAAEGHALRASESQRVQDDLKHEG